MGTGYALLVSVSDYRDRGMADLMAGTADLCMMRAAVTEGLHFRKDNVRVLGEKGAVRLDAFAKALKEFAALLCGEDTFLLYVSGHGTGNTLCFSDEDVSVSSVVEVLAGMKARGRILILDSCFSGSATVPTKRQLHLDDSLSNFAGRGVAVMAAAASDEEAWLDESGRFSCYTGAVCAAMLSRKEIGRAPV